MTHASEVVWRFDWSVVAEQVIRVYETVAVPGVVVSVTSSPGGVMVSSDGEAAELPTQAAAHVFVAKRSPAGR